MQTKEQQSLPKHKCPPNDMKGKQNQEDDKEWSFWYKYLVFT